MNPTVTLALITAIAVLGYVIVEGIFFVPNPAYAYSSCKSVNNQLACTTSPDEVCTFHGPTQVVCGTRDSHIVPYG